MVALKKIEPSHCYTILYFNGQKITELVVKAECRTEAIAELKRLGFSEMDIYSINP
jgi:hypothetical protein